MRNQDFVLVSTYCFKPKKQKNGTYVSSLKLEAGNLQDYINSFIYRKKNEESDVGGVGTWAAEPRLPSEGGECACARIPCSRIPPPRNSLLSTAYCVQSSSVYRFRPLPIANTFIGVDNLSFVLKVHGHKCC